MTVLNSARVAAISSINVVTSAARTADALVTSAYHAADVLETNASTWAANAKADAQLNAMQSSLFRRDEMAARWAEREHEIQSQFRDNPEQIASFEKYRKQIDDMLTAKAAEPELSSGKVAIA